jgi:K(+)-stimulated pyrophosphate-energized sodium pump
MSTRLPPGQYETEKWPVLHYGSVPRFDPARRDFRAFGEVPVVVGFVLGKEALAGVLAGSIVAGFMMAVMMANTGGAWDNAKKHIEEGHLGGKGSDTHKAAVVGDTVGDPFKDTAGPSLNILLKLMAIVSIVIAPLL